MGSKEDGSSSLTIARGDASSGPDSARSPVLGGMSEAELDAIVSMLRTDKNLVVAAVPAASERLGALTEQLLRSSSGLLLDPREAREEAARQAWYIGLGEKVAGPLDIAALRTHWERGELGPDSLCWRKGFDGWQPVCRVHGLAELLSPRANLDPSTPEDLVPNPRADALDFPLKGAEALRILAEDTPPPLPILAPSLPPPVLEPEPVTAPALEAEPDTVPDAPRAQDVAGVHALLPATPPTRVEVRVRGGAWLALGGGLVGGILVSGAVWLLGLSAGGGLLARGASSETTTPARGGEATTSAPARAPVNATTPRAAVASKPELTAPVPLSATPLPASEPARADAMAPVPAISAGSGIASSGVSKPDVTALVPAVGAGSGLGGAAVSKATPGSTLTPLARPTPTGAETVAAPPRAVASVRPAPVDPSMSKPTKTELAFQSEPSAPKAVAARAAEAKEEEEDDELSLDEDFERELFDPAKRAVPAKRTVWVPPAPTPKEPPASLAESDVFSVVVANKADITSCVSAQKLQSEDGSRKVVVRWTILPSGRVTDVVTETAKLRGTPLALCLEEKIRAWTFPRHREQGGPVRFPFVF
ncbi:AgmX/PglI C-terminal domain-containing protein [Hyalangium gracile]|uniref:AgmX/PglI C-terminal domain-containing protein n=1 Tax=Hyalangium gracile TaxID=394092 RepID=UPI001CCE322A|nr:AgmX/PglI C-terminal domain-containing protein [Hyalangium gracile]